MPADEFCGRMDHDVRPVLKRPEQVRRGERVVHDDGELVPAGDFAHGVEIDHVDAGVPEGFVVNRLGLRRDGLFKILYVVRVDEDGVDSVPGQRVGKQVVGAAVKRAGRNNLVPRARDVQNGIGDRRRARRHAQAGGAALQRGDALLKNLRRRVRQARIDIARNRQAEAALRLRRVLKHVGRSLIDGDGPRARRRVGLFLPGLNLQRFKSKFSLAHRDQPFLL